VPLAYVGVAGGTLEKHRLTRIVSRGKATKPAKWRCATPETTAAFPGAIAELGEPVVVKKLASGFVDTLERVRAEKIALRLKKIGREAFLSIAVEIRE
jgi:hypothetical protein